MLKYFYTLLIICLCKLYVSEQSIIVIDRDLLSIPKPVNPIEKHKVIIVGAGVSGLSAATLLLQQNFSDILILEASSQIGGRISTVKFGDSLIDFGAQWVLGGKGNPVYELSKPYDVLVPDDVDDNYDFRTTPSSGVNMTQFYELYELLYTIFDDKAAINGSKGSLADFFNNRFENIVKKVGADRKTADAVRDLICKLQNAFVGSDNLNEAGILGFARYKDIDANFTCAWKTGYHTFIDIILRKYEGNNINTMVMNRIQFNKVVQNIDWSDNSVILTCEDGSKYSADHVILTVSLGVLKHSAKFMFTPPLPSVKMDAIQSIGMGTVEKIFLKFPYSWWSEDEFDMSFIWTEEEKRQYRIHSNHGGWPTDILGFHYIQNEPTILQGWIVGESAREMENFSDEVVLAVCYDIMSKFIPEIQIPEPTNITRTHWRSNRFFRGSYSFPTVESDVCNLSAADVAEPIYNHSNIPVLMFAGEATHDTFYATVHGALEAGWREALRVLKYQNFTLKNISN